MSLEEHHIELKSLTNKVPSAFSFQGLLFIYFFFRIQRDIQMMGYFSSVFSGNRKYISGYSID